MEKLAILAFDAKGHEVRTDFLANELPPPPKPYDFVVLGSGEFVGTHLRGAAKEFVNEAGPASIPASSGI